MNKIQFELDGRQVEAAPGETIWQVAKREGVEIPHLCYSPEPDYRADGNCRACMVEIEGERVLAASCMRMPAVGMKVKSASERAASARKMVIELLVADQPERTTSHDPDSKFWQWADRVEVAESRFPKAERWTGDYSHPAMSVNLDACIQCGLCVRACREVQVNDVIGMAYRNHGAKVVFDFDDPMGESTCVACGECVQACPTGALMPASLLDEQHFTRTVYADRKVDSLCPFCGVGCQVTYHVKDEKIVYAEGRDGPANHNRLCVKGRFGYDYIHHPHRLTKPLIRLPNAKKSAMDQVDPANPFTHFREATWEEALDVAAKGLVKIRDEKGPKALAGFGSAKGSNEEAYLFQKLVRTGFGSNNVDHCTRLCHASSVAALMEGVNSGAVSAPFSAALDAEVIIIIGANPTANHPVAATFFKNAVKKNGAKLIVMDPRKQPLSRLAYKHLQFKPGADVAMLNGMLHTIITEDLTDKQYIAGYTEGFEELKEKIKEFPPEKMEKICGVPAETLKEVARLYAKAKSSIIFWGMGISQHVHGTDNSRCLIALALVTGQIGRPGTGLHPLRGQNNVQGASDAGLIPMLLPDYQPVGRTDLRTPFEEVWRKEIDPVPGLTVVEIMDAIHAGTINGMYIEGENPAMSDPDLQHAREALAKLDHLVVQDLFVTETAFHADVILPASAFAEKVGTFTNTDRRVQMSRQVLNPPGDARQDIWIIQQIANRMGCGWTYESVSDVYTEMASLMPSLDNISWERVDREGAVTYPADDPQKPGNEIIFTTGFPTASGRAKIVPAHVTPPDEVPDENYPMVLSTGRILEHWHTGSMTRRAGVLDSIEPEATALMSPRDMRRLNIGPGDFIRLETRRGAIEVKARSDRDVPENMVFMPFCYAEAAANLLTNPALDPFGKIPEFKFCAARVEKAELRSAAE
ncbi:formate dehydrogenase, alpha subunit [Afipia carboxidovorans OM5]|uniref:Formate dehydrogenase subunit alpha n=1 Tax=Afipia carboxidovorans (strain ATCC 49405 / DSM 1227 / KCTC 32145 / OM5) TaxID=504832 RepID=B6JGD1_AFIC5|nr:formate dehydrogenase subunit alpha [Afipia carboxidovorans]ACI93813.1 formate dehydrogenase, alpha subunit [Afipia carboxidovorans OM5]AEI02506.1 formate dehydrogenase subunit alpha [Afipia carboxidovorans OM4]AEI06082.1 formate dehydrogenase subunit alpha [Afipia carboxidovorans OM5]